LGLGEANLDHFLRVDWRAGWEVPMGTLQVLVVAWGVVTAVLVCVVIYRSTLENREEDQIFLDAAGQSMATEQRAIVTRIESLGKPIIALAVVSGGLILTVAGMWLWQGFQSF
jgi:hypothetical protein